MSRHRLPALSAEQNEALATTPTDELLALPMLQPNQVTDSLNAYQISKRANSLRVMAEAVRWGKRGARVNYNQSGNHYNAARKRRIEPAWRRRLPTLYRGIDSGSDGAFITGSDFLMDGGVTAAYWFGDLRPKMTVPHCT
jgi:hypothetical protein